ncbi:MAG: TPM domain-containing protein [Pseudomonadota bacterium]
MKRTFLLFAALWAFVAAPSTAQDFPELTGRVVDNANIIPALKEAELTGKLEALQNQTRRQMVIVTVTDLQDYDVADFGYRLGREWGIGDSERNDGVVLLVAPNERKVTIEVGYGLEGTLSDAYSYTVIQDKILPRFRDDDYPGGITAGTDAIITQLQLPADEAARVAQEASASVETRERSGGIPFGALIWLGFMFFFFVLPLLRGGSQRRRYRKRRKGPWGKRRGKKRDDDDDDDWFDDDDDGWGRTARDIILWEVGSAVVRGAMSGGGGGSWGGGGGFGGGFSGGGGSFGGGGASGGW